MTSSGYWIGLSNPTRSSISFEEDCRSGMYCPFCSIGPPSYSPAFLLYLYLSLSPQRLEISAREDRRHRKSLDIADPRTYHYTTAYGACNLIRTFFGIASCCAPLAVAADWLLLHSRLVCLTAGSWQKVKLGLFVLVPLVLVVCEIT